MSQVFSPAHLSTISEAGESGGGELKKPDGSSQSFWSTAGLDDAGRPVPRAQLAMALTGLPVLLVDDNIGVREICSRHLEDFGCEVLGVDSGVDAIKTLESGLRFPLIEIDGFGIYSIIKDLNLDPPPKVIMITGHPDPDTRLQASKLGIDAFLLKPVSSSDLLDAILGLIDT